MKKYLAIFILIIFASYCNAQDSLQICPWLNPVRPIGIIDKPAFYVNGYAFFPEKKLIGVSRYWVHPMSSSGIGINYIDTLRGADYDSFEFVNINRGLVKDKNRTLFGFDSNVANVIWSINQYEAPRTIGNKEIIIFDENNTKLKADSIYSDIAFLRNDSLFVYTEHRYEYFENKIHDISSFKKVSYNIYQDCKNVYQLSGGKVKCIEDEQIIETHKFVAYEEESRISEEGNNSIYVGNKNFYGGFDKLFCHKLDSYRFMNDSYYYFYNDCIYFFPSNYPLGVNYRSGCSDFSHFLEGKNDSRTKTWEYEKVKLLGKDLLIYDNTKLYYKTDSIKYPVGFNLEELEYVGRFPYRLYLELIPMKVGLNHCNNSPILRLGQQLYIICNNNLVILKGIRDRNQTDDFKNFNLNNLRFINEYYFTDGLTLYCNQGIKGELYNYKEVYRTKKKPYLTSKDIDLDSLIVLDRYFACEKSKRIYYNYLPVNKEAKLQYQPPAMGWYRRSDADILRNSETNKSIDYRLDSIDFSKLQIIPNTDYLTDETYLIYKYNVVGKIDYKTLKIRSNDFVEDAQHYYSKNLTIEKEKLGIKLFIDSKKKYN